MCPNMVKTGIHHAAYVHMMNVSMWYQMITSTCRLDLEETRQPLTARQPTNQAEMNQSANALANTDPQWAIPSGRGTHGYCHSIHGSGHEVLGLYSWRCLVSRGRWSRFNGFINENEPGGTFTVGSFRWARRWPTSLGQRCSLSCSLSCAPVFMSASGSSRLSPATSSSPLSPSSPSCCLFSV